MIAHRARVDPCFRRGDNKWAFPPHIASSQIFAFTLLWIFKSLLNFKYNNIGFLFHWLCAIDYHRMLSTGTTQIMRQGKFGALDLVGSPALKLFT